MGDDIVRFLKTDGHATRRAWLAHCTVAAVAAWVAGLAPAAAQGTAAARTATGGPVLVLGDSLSAEYGLPRGTGWVALLQARLDRERPGVRVVNASVSGDTTSGGRSRLPPLLAQHRPSVVVIELGGNDALRGLPLAMTEDNLTAMTRAAQGAGARVVLAGMQVPPNYGRKYGEDFFALFARVARAERASLVPFLLKGVADDTARAEQLFQADRIHPTAAAHPIMLDNVWPVLRPLLK
jgi:acyl-CoA thioesterase-1